jgi:hypothetical protein
LHSWQLYANVCTILTTWARVAVKVAEELGYSDYRICRPRRRWKPWNRPRGTLPRSDRSIRNTKLVGHKHLSTKQLPHRNIQGDNRKTASAETLHSVVRATRRPTPSVSRNHFLGLWRLTPSGLFSALVMLLLLCSYGLALEGSVTNGIVMSVLDCPIWPWRAGIPIPHFKMSMGISHLSDLGSTSLLRAHGQI